jgi:glycosyltransferase involved in cell wall biosynthesis
MTPRVSIVMPAYQAERFVGAAVSSALWQTYPNLELVVVDDGSTDGTARIVEAHEGPIKLVRQENRGVGAARNAGVAAATGELVTYCDADDILLPRHVEALVATFESSGGGLATANSYWLLPGGIHPSKMRYKGKFPPPEAQRLAILEQNFVSTMTLFRRTLVDEIGGMDESRRLGEDWDFWLRAIFTGHRVALQREPLSLYRWGEESLSADWQAMDADIEHRYDDLDRRVELTDDEREYVRRRRAGPGPQRLGRRGDEALRAGRYAEAARSYREAADLCPSERMLLWKARVLRPAPRLLGPLVRSRQLRIEKQLGIGPKHVR